MMQALRLMAVERFWRYAMSITYALGQDDWYGRCMERWFKAHCAVTWIRL